MIKAKLLNQTIEKTLELTDKDFEGKELDMPIEHKPNKDFLAYHRDNIFKGL